MKKALVIGPGGAGKSTFARALRDKTGLPLYYLDMLWHMPDRTTVSREEFDERLGAILEKPRWILDGNYSRTLERRLVYADAVFLFDLPADECLKGVESRRGKPREDMPWIEYGEDPEFTQWIRDFREREMPGIYELLDAYREGREIHIFHSRNEAWEWLKGVK